MEFKEVEKFINSHPEFTSRKDRYRAEALYFGLEPEECKNLMSFDRYLRDIWEIDEVGIKLEKENHKTPEQHQFENHLFPLSKIINN